MEQEKCPNKNECPVFKEGIVKDEHTKKFYAATFCTDNNGYTRCKRFQTKAALGFCPDFVLPDSPMMPDEIMDRLEQER